MLRLSLILIFAIVATNQVESQSPSNGVIRNTNVLDKSKCSCTAVTLPRIVGGRVSSVSYPWTVYLSLTGSACTGFIINSRQVITAAHCTASKTPGQVTVYAGINDLNKRTSTNAYRAQYLDVHPGWANNGGNLGREGDFSVITVDRPFDFNNPYIRPACIDTVIRDYGRTLAMGWGITDAPLRDLSGNPLNTPARTSLLKEADFNNIARSQTSQNNVPSSCVNNFSVCLLPVAEGDSACSGDSGGPVHAVLGAKWVAVGTASYVTGRRVIYNGQDATQICYGPSVYSRVAYYKSFLDSTTGSHNLCNIDANNILS